MKSHITPQSIYSQYPEHVRSMLRELFSRTLEEHPYPQNTDDQIIWIHDMNEALRGIESLSATLTDLDRQVHN